METNYKERTDLQIDKLFKFFLCFLKLSPFSKHLLNIKKLTSSCSVAKYIENITCPRVDMNFIFEWSTRYLTSEHSERVRSRVEHEKIKFISMSEYVIFCLSYKHRCNTKSACFQRRDLLCNHNDGDLFTCEDTCYLHV